MSKEVVYVVGHKSPDTDSICSAIAYAYLKQKKFGVNAKPARQGEINPETKFVLEKFGFEVPELLTDGTGKKVILVDHNEKAQSLDNLDKAEILEIIDHHKIGDVTTPNPIFFLAMPVGCSATIITKLYEEYGVEIPKNIAGIMLSSILSDTVVFKSPTTTDLDKETCKKLAKIAGIEDFEKFGVELKTIKAKGDLEQKTPKELLMSDFKDYVMAGKKVGVGQIELIELSVIETIKPKLLEEMTKLKKEEGYHSIFLMLTDIMKEGTELLTLTDDPSIVKKAFGKELKENSVWLEGVMSRKKQVVPPLEKVFK
ncbi:manganese-dependent inorganic pyrophosphatase [Candidatus Bathyarchaeota archaeon]|nr:MAG: manganese-dependent inorganic pyrophosphatase [Candidatus Bathyarchaeota archaeon]